MFTIETIANIFIIFYKLLLLLSGNADRTITNMYNILYM